jgi:hypothetical protein
LAIEELQAAPDFFAGVVFTLAGGVFELNAHQRGARMSMLEAAQ